MWHVTTGLTHLTSVALLPKHTPDKLVIMGTKCGLVEKCCYKWVTIVIMYFLVDGSSSLNLSANCWTIPSLFVFDQWDQYQNIARRLKIFCEQCSFILLDSWQQIVIGQFCCGMYIIRLLPAIFRFMSEIIFN